MCELFAMSSRLPAGVDLCLEEFARHGGLTAPHKDGWGIAYYDEDGAVRLYKEAEPASRSDWVQFIGTHHMRAAIVLSHIRRATQGRRSLKNTQPFRRELGGHCHVFAHNGDLPDIAANTEFEFGFHRPLGETDSEHAFCSLLGRLEEPWLSTSGVPPIETRQGIVSEFARSIALLGMANFVYSDGDAVFAHGNRRQASPTSAPRPPGLHVLHRVCDAGSSELRTEGLQIFADPGEQEMTLLASVPLTGEDWRPLGEGELLTIRAGKTLHSSPSS